MNSGENRKKGAQGTPKSGEQSPITLARTVTPTALGQKSRKPRKPPSALPNQEPKTRNRPIKACFPCRGSKAGCDQLKPQCGRCINAGISCRYESDQPSPAELEHSKAIKRTTRMLESQRRQLAHDSVEKNPRKAASESVSAILDLPPILPALSSPLYEGQDEDLAILETGFEVGYATFTDRIGGLYCPDMADELAALLIGPVYSESSIKGKSRILVPTFHDFHYDPVCSGSGSDLRPGNTYLSPAVMSRHQYGLNTCPRLGLPGESFAKFLLQGYWANVHPVAPTLYRPSFETIFQSIYLASQADWRAPSSKEALVLATLFSGAVSRMNEDLDSASGHVIDWKEQVISLQKTTEDCLARTNLVRTTNFETLQAFVTYLIPLCRASCGRAHSSAVATAVRMAQMMELHRDPAHYNLPVIEQQLRRIVWHQIAFLDIRTTEACGPSAILSQCGFDTKYPLNLDERDLKDGEDCHAQSEGWTDMTLPLIRMQCNEMMRMVFAHQSDTSKADLDRLLLTVSQFREKMKEKYLPSCNYKSAAQTELQFYTASTLVLLTSRMCAMVLRRYLKVNKDNNLQVRLQKQLNQHCRKTMVIGRQMQLNPSLAPWRWYSGALHQFHDSLFLLIDILVSPDPETLSIIWEDLAWVFQMPAEFEQLPNDHKARWATRYIKDEMAKFQRLKKPRYSLSLARGEDAGRLRETRPTRSSHRDSSSTSHSESFADDHSEHASTLPVTAYDSLPHRSGPGEGQILESGSWSQMGLEAFEIDHSNMHMSNEAVSNVTTIATATHGSYEATVNTGSFNLNVNLDEGHQYTPHSSFSVPPSFPTSSKFQHNSPYRNSRPVGDFSMYSQPTSSPFVSQPLAGGLYSDASNHFQQSGDNSMILDEHGSSLPTNDYFDANYRSAYRGPSS